MGKSCELTPRQRAVLRDVAVGMRLRDVVRRHGYSARGLRSLRKTEAAQAYIQRLLNELDAAAIQAVAALPYFTLKNRLSLR